MTACRAFDRFFTLFKTIQKVVDFTINFASIRAYNLMKKRNYTVLLIFSDRLIIFLIICEYMFFRKFNERAGFKKTFKVGNIRFPSGIAKNFVISFGMKEE